MTALKAELQAPIENVSKVDIVKTGENKSCEKEVKLSENNDEHEAKLIANECGKIEATTSVICRELKSVVDEQHDVMSDEKERIKDIDKNRPSKE
ncbi:hypothetical protein RND71_031894 [Anisodus tanguticus]|uniref:Uncharacterized protein n=1 Tax=Anisodus tanguticus TaxID=243964 RepID=A0AAE1RBK0_9SOLA|nr:hypothetical protein RND71_031894 [Anisodus tanguticus]